MLKTIAASSNKKLGGCAATYRAGLENVYSTCPSSCILKPEEFQGAQRLDEEYLSAVLDSVPIGGVSWTYTHFPRSLLPAVNERKTCINISSDTLSDALASYVEGHPTVIVQPSNEIAKVDVHPTILGDVRLVRCPAEYSERTCNTCGGDTPLCARHNRDYIVKFTAHGVQAKKINIRRTIPILTLNTNPTPTGGCYGNTGPTRLQWEKTKGSTEDDAQRVLDFARSLPAGTKLRHHVVGDFGKSE